MSDTNAGSPLLLTVDAFCHCPFTGNPAAVCIMPAPRSDAWMQAMAAEMNLSETAFLLHQGDHYKLRWFTPAVEVDLCGHATLASAKALWATGQIHASQTIAFQTRSGLLTARPDTDHATGLIWLNFPAKVSQEVAAPDGLVEGLGLPSDAVRSIGRNQFDFLVEVADESAVRQLAPHFQALLQFQARGIIVTSPASTENRANYDFVSRFFAPRSGVNEDPVTGSAHCALAPFWAHRLQKQRLRGYQASRRGGFVDVVCEADRVHLGGKAVVVSQGRLSAEAWEAGT
ncbi:MAG: PhzF family phenazine biosynthesis protein [Isosphaeraceae bacterium]